MPTGTDLMGLGMASPLADALGNSPSQLACLGTGQTTAATIKSTNVELVPSSSNTGAIFQANALVGSPYFLFNAQSTSAVVYPPVSSYMNGTQNGSFTLAQNKAAILFQYKTASGNDYWWSNLTA